MMKEHQIRFCYCQMHAHIGKVRCLCYSSLRAHGCCRNRQVFFHSESKYSPNSMVLIDMLFAYRKPKPMPKSAPSLGISGDGRCLFRSVVHGTCLRAGKHPPSEGLEKELADELRDKVADEFIKRRKETEWFIEGDFDAYVMQMRQPHIWGGEPELLMSSHVLQVPITVYMRDKKSDSLKIIAEYGEEYGSENPVRVLYHGYGHYDALQSPSVTTPQTKSYMRRWK